MLHPSYKKSYIGIDVYNVRQNHVTLSKQPYDTAVYEENLLKFFLMLFIVQVVHTHHRTIRIKKT